MFAFDKDFKMKTTTELYDDLQKANESGADAFAIQDIQLDIARNIFANNPDDFQRYMTRQDFYPFSGKSKEEIIALKSTNNTTRFLKVLEENYSYIFDQIEMEEGADFYLLTRKKQFTQIKKRVKAIQKEREENPLPDIKEEIIE